MTDKNYEKALEFLFPSEGGYVNHKNDKGGATNMGITQSTYNNYMKKKNLSTKDVKLITRAEAEKIYYEDYWKTSGADKISDFNMAITLFDTAVLHGPGTARKFYNESGGDLNKFLDIRQKSYDKIVANDPTQKDFYKGWNNRVNRLRGFIQSNQRNCSEQNQVLKTGIEMNVDQSGNKIFTPEEIGNMNPQEFQQNMHIIDQQLQEGLIKPQSEQKKDYSGYVNPVTGSGKIYTREDIAAMSTKEYAAVEDEINSQMNAIGVPTKKEMETASQKGGIIYVKAYTRQDGTEVKGYYRST